ncbi:MAG: DUF1538 family protein [Magnetococcales bacterium]|nr:DUF1538 family protein [Magnetococcales bacterium]
MNQENGSEYSSRNGTVVIRRISYNLLTPKIRRHLKGGIVPHVAPPVKLNSKDIYRLLHSYFSHRFLDQFRVILPLPLLLIAFQWLTWRHFDGHSVSIVTGVLALSAGLMLFLEGLRSGLIPFWETVGNLLPQKTSLSTLLLFMFLTGFGLTLSEPGLAFLPHSDSRIAVAQAPFVHTLLHQHSLWLTWAMGTATGLALSLGVLLLSRGLSLKPALTILLLASVVLTWVLSRIPHLDRLAELAWDAASVTLGPVSISLILALGKGMVPSITKGRKTRLGLGLIGLTALAVVAVVLLLGLIMAPLLPAPDIDINAYPLAPDPRVTSWHLSGPIDTILWTLRAIVPTVVLPVLACLFLLREKIPEPGMLAYGTILAALGLTLTHFGSTLGLSITGTASAPWEPTVPTQASVVPANLPPWAEHGTILIFAFALTFASTFANPGLNILGSLLENVSNGVSTRKGLLRIVAIGAASGIVMGVLKEMLAIHFIWFLLPATLALLLLAQSSLVQRAALAWDCGGIIPGPITLPALQAMGLGINGTLAGSGLLAMAAMGSMIAVLLASLRNHIHTP